MNLNKIENNLRLDIKYDGQLNLNKEIGLNKITLYGDFGVLKK
jgi:hypothetical protein